MGLLGRLSMWFPSLAQGLLQSKWIKVVIVFIIWKMVHLLFPPHFVFTWILPLRMSSFLTSANPYAKPSLGTSDHTDLLLWWMHSCLALPTLALDQWLIQGWFCTSSSGIFGTVWRHLWLSQLGGRCVNHVFYIFCILWYSDVPGPWETARPRAS